MIPACIQSRKTEKYGFQHDFINSILQSWFLKHIRALAARASITTSQYVVNAHVPQAGNKKLIIMYSVYYPNNVWRL